MTKVEKSLNMIKERAFKYGVEILSNEEVIALSIGDSIDEDPVVIARHLLVECNGIENLAKMSTEEFVPYIGDRALYVSGTIELAKRMKKYRYLYDENFNNPETVFNYVNSKMAYEDQETLKVLVLNTKNYLIGEKDIFIGTNNQSLVGQREVLAYALRKNACSIIVVHNHPSGQCNPSNEDISVTKKLQEGCKAIGIQLLDHIIIGNGEFCTLKGKGVL